MYIFNALHLLHLYVIIVYIYILYEEVNGLRLNVALIDEVDLILMHRLHEDVTHVQLVIREGGFRANASAFQQQGQAFGAAHHRAVGQALVVKSRLAELRRNRSSKMRLNSK